MARSGPADRVLRDVVRALERAERIAVALIKREVNRPGWATETAAGLGRVVDELRRELDGIPISQVQAALDDAWDVGTLWGDAAAAPVAAAAAPGVLNPARRPAILTALIADLHGQLNVLPVQIVRATADAYRDVVATVTGDVAAGVRTVDEAAREAVRDLEKRGIRGFTDRAGRQWRASTYARMAVRTAYTRASNESRLARYTERRVLAVIVSDAYRECPLCRPWENKVLAITETDLPPFPVNGTVAEATAAGLLHPNCRHFLNAYTPGLTQATPMPAETPGGLWPAPPAAR